MASAIIASAVPAIISAIGAALNSRKTQETPIQGQQRETIDQILRSLKGQGPFSDLFNTSNEAFQQSYVQPAKQLFESQIAPSIQQSFIAGGPAGNARTSSTALQDSLARAGIDLDQMLNQQFAQFQQQGQNRQLGALQSILDQSPGALQQNQSRLSGGLEGLASFFGGPSGAEALSGLFRNRSGNNNQISRSNSLQDTFLSPRQGFEKEPQYYDWRSGVQQ
jgi:hypothetical protein